jgi:hypothetical protein
MNKPYAWIALAIIAAGITIVVLADIFGAIGNTRGDQIVSLVAAMALLVFIGGGALGAYQGRGTMFLQHAAIWLGLIAVCVLLYNYRHALGFNFD